jgi:hypothetical protein
MSSLVLERFSSLGKAIRPRVKSASVSGNPPPSGEAQDLFLEMAGKILL